MTTLKRKASAELDNPRHNRPERTPLDPTSSVEPNQPADPPPTRDNKKTPIASPTIHDPTGEAAKGIEQCVTDYLEEIGRPDGEDANSSDNNCQELLRVSSPSMQDYVFQSRILMCVPAASRRIPSTQTRLCGRSREL